jgi:hypothetical protein
MLKQEEILVEEDTGVDINNRHMDRIRVNMLVITRYVIPCLHYSSAPCPWDSFPCRGADVSRAIAFWTPLINSNNPKLLLLLLPLLLELHQLKDRMLGLNTPHTGLLTVTTSTILNVSSSLSSSVMESC